MSERLGMRHWPVVRAFPFFFLSPRNHIVLLSVIGTRNCDVVVALLCRFGAFALFLKNVLGLLAYSSLISCRMNVFVRLLTVLIYKSLFMYVLTN
jgi:hypothetical protein